MNIVLATHNRDKVREIAEIMKGLAVEWSSAYDFPDIPQVEENGETLEANALLKAKALMEATGLPALADDTGLFVDALKGAPGVQSARYAGPKCVDADNVRKLLREMKGVPKEDRGAAFRTVVAICFPDEAPVYLTGKVTGKITKTPKGSEGFGYDPVFEPEGMGKVFAEMTAEEKNAVSHRGRAFVKVREWMVRRLAAEEKSV